MRIIEGSFTPVFLQIETNFCARTDLSRVMWLFSWNREALFPKHPKASMHKSNICATIF